jgi:hypothetical protein
LSVPHRPSAAWLALVLGIVAAGCGATSRAAPAASTAPQSLAFGTQLVGQATAPQSVTLSNNGNAPLAISSIAVTGDYSQGNDCGRSLAAGSSCTIEVTFNPQATGARPGSLSIADDAAGSPQTVALTGTGAVAAPAPTPTLVQHVASTSQPIGKGEAGNNYVFTLPNPVLAGNCLILGVARRSGTSFASTPVTDSNGNAWPTTPSASVADANGKIDLAIFVLPNAHAGTTTITVHFTAAIQPFSYTVSEFYDVASSSPVNGSSGASSVSAPNIHTGTFTPGDNDASGGNLIWSFFWADDTFGSDVTAFAAGGSFTLLDANIFWHTDASAHSASQYHVQTTSASITPGMTATMGTNGSFVGLSIALRAAHAGTAPSAGIRIVKVLHFTNEVPSRSMTLQAPTTGNLVVLVTSQNSSLIDVTGVTDNGNGSYTKVQPSPDEPQFWIAGDHTANPNLKLTITSTGSPQPSSFTVYDITGAATSPIGVSAGRGQAVCDGVTTLTDYPSITPGAANGLTIAACELGQGPGRGFAPGSPAGAIWDFVNYDSETDVSTMNNADCRGHLYTTSTAPEHWNWTIASNPSNSCDAAAVHLLQ